MRRHMLLRHAKSDWPEGVDDHDRPLAPRGRKAAPLMGRYMAANALRPDLALVSTARRARETWDLAGSAFTPQVLERRERQLYEAGAETIVRVVREISDDVGLLLMVGHNPGFEDAATMLAALALPWASNSLAATGSTPCPGLSTLTSRSETPTAMLETITV